MAECDPCIFNKSTPQGYTCSLKLNRSRPYCPKRKSRYSTQYHQKGEPK